MSVDTDLSDVFPSLFNNALQNAISIMSLNGVVLDINQAFTQAFGYEKNDLAGKHCRVLFIEKDRLAQKPETEIETTRMRGASSDNNYLVHKDGTPVWVAGESILVENGRGEPYIVKIIHNIHAQKLLEKFLMESNEFVDSIFESVRESALLVIDTRLRVVKANAAFFSMFSQPTGAIEGKRLSEIDHPLWADKDFQSLLREMIITRNFKKAHVAEWVSLTGRKETVHIVSKFIEGHIGVDKRVLLVINGKTANDSDENSNY